MKNLKYVSAFILFYLLTSCLSRSLDNIEIMSSNRSIEEPKVCEKDGEFYLQTGIGSGRNFQAAFLESQADAKNRLIECLFPNQIEHFSTINQTNTEITFKSSFKSVIVLKNLKWSTLQPRQETQLVEHDSEDLKVSVVFQWSQSEARLASIDESSIREEKCLSDQDQCLQFAENLKRTSSDREIAQRPMALT